MIDNTTVRRAHASSWKDIVVVVWYRRRKTVASVATNLRVTRGLNLTWLMGVSYVHRGTIGWLARPVKLLSCRCICSTMYPSISLECTSLKTFAEHFSNEPDFLHIFQRGTSRLWTDTGYTDNWFSMFSHKDKPRVSFFSTRGWSKDQSAQNRYRQDLRNSNDTNFSKIFSKNRYENDGEKSCYKLLTRWTFTSVLEDVTDIRSDLYVKSWNIR